MLRSLKKKTEAALCRRKTKKPVEKSPIAAISWPLRSNPEPPLTDQWATAMGAGSEPRAGPMQASSISDYTNTETTASDSEPELEDEPRSGPFVTKYIPFVDSSAMRSNMFISPASSHYGMVNPAIMSGFGGDDESIWLVDDEETDEEADAARGDARKDESPLAPVTDQPLPVLSRPEASAPQVGFRYRINQALFEDDEFATPPADTGQPMTVAGVETSNPDPDSQIGSLGYGRSPLAKLIPRAPRSENQEQRRKRKLDEADVQSTASASNPYVALLERQDSAMTEAYLRRLYLSERRGHEVADDFSFGQRYQKDVDTSDVLVTHQRVPAARVPSNRECSICVDTKEEDLFPRFSVTASCTHAPATCLECLEISIRSDLNSKLWSDIRCPECRELLDYTDIQRYADEETFRRYETLALRAAMAEAENFFWCTSGCGSGQIHSSGQDQPIVICLHCSHRSCFHHNVTWHQSLTCEEYDQLLADPENFRSQIETDNEAWAAAQQAQLEADKVMAQGLLAEEQLEREGRQLREREERERTRRAVELARQIAARRKMEEEQSRETVGRTTKPCPGCGWAIEKNEGCSHMTCIKCRYEFCWACYQTWTSRHSINCRG